MDSRSPRPRAADDFAVIRARIEELRRECAQLPADDEPPRAIGPRPYAVARQSDPRDRRLSPEASEFIRRLFRTA